MKRHVTFKTILAASTAIVGVALLSSAAFAADTATDKEILKRLEALENKVQQLEEENGQLQADKQNLEKKVNATSNQVTAVQNQVSTVASQVPAADAPKVTRSPTNLFALSSADGKNTIALTGRLQLDAGDYVGFHADNPVVGIGNNTTGHLADGVNARRARIGVTGKVLGDWSYAFIYDFGNSQDTTPKGIETAQFAFNGFKNTAIEVGYADTLFSLDEATGSNNIMFLERSSSQVIATQFGSGDNRSEFGIRNWGDRYWVGAYVTGPTSGSESVNSAGTITASSNHTLTANTISSFQRATYQVLQDKDYSLHVGVGATELFRAANAGPGTAQTLTLSDQPELRIDPTTFLNTGALGTLTNPVTGGQVYNVELAAAYQGLYAQGEYFHYNVDRLGKSSAKFDGGYGEVSYTLGGKRTYAPNVGAYSGVIPDKPFSLSDGTWGAWELAARVDYVSLVDQFTPGVALSAQPFAVNGGSQTAFTAGLNWYINYNMRWMFNFIHVDYNKANSAAVTGAALGVPVGSKINALAVRWQAAF